MPALSRERRQLAPESQGSWSPRFWRWGCRQLARPVPKSPDSCGPQWGCGGCPVPRQDPVGPFQFLWTVMCGREVELAAEEAGGS